MTKIYYPFTPFKIVYTLQLYKFYINLVSSPETAATPPRSSAEVIPDWAAPTSSPLQHLGGITYWYRIWQRGSVGVDFTHAGFIKIDEIIANKVVDNFCSAGKWRMTQGPETAVSAVTGTIGQ